MDITLTTRKNQIYDLTEQIHQRLSNRDLKNGLLNIFAPHATGILFLGENEAGINSDYLKFMEKIAPERGGWAHDKIDNNAHAHLRSAFMGTSPNVPVRDGKLQLGTWQKILFAETDGDRERKFILTFIEGT
ncbi:MAG: YjbQ family protein [Candidatus Altiarchaeota archaeon]|nr:YjbQ family protein [Candidatus Altiarchaeota archaeon]